MIIRQCGSDLMKEIAPGIDMQTLFSEGLLSVDFIRVAPNAVEHEVVHLETDEIIFLIEGHLEARIDGIEQLISAGDCVVLKKGTRHLFANRSTSPIRLLAICSPAYSSNDVHVVAA